ncbi:SMI1/KNR4 family protein [Kitasatospora sp. NPDC086791]|uniref:SMI1/KNR4 family protein n=1 Tax=Kitasatospora sp. NPDC086791 TaxID=3155178 RepID=UPI00342CF1DC
MGMPEGMFHDVVRVDPWIRPPRPESWAAVEAWAGIELPADFKEFVRLYGDGLVMRHLNVPHPDGIDPMIDFMKRARRKLDRVLPDYVEDLRSLSFGPADLVPWGYSNWDGDDCFLVPRSGGEWGVVVIFRQLARIVTYEGGFTKFITGVLSGQEVPTGWPLFEPRWEPIPGSPLV